MVVATRLVIMLLAPAAALLPVRYIAEDCGDASTHGKFLPPTVTNPSSPHTGDVVYVTHRFNFDTPIHDGQFTSAVSWKGLPLRHETGPLCGTDTLFPVYLGPLKVADVNFHGMPCQSQNLVGAVQVHYSVKLAQWLPPGVGNSAFKMMAQSTNGDKLFCLKVNATAAAFPSSVYGEIEKMFCKMAGNKQMEGMVTKQVCTLAEQKLKITIPDCQADAEKAWDMVAQMCPKPSEETMVATAALPSPGEIEKMFCKMAGNKQMEDMVTKQVCTLAEQKLKITIPDCQASAEKVWDMVANMCPKPSEGFAVAPAAVEKEQAQPDVMIV